MASIFFTIYKETPLEQNYSRGVLWYQISTFNVSVGDSAYAVDYELFLREVYLTKYHKALEFPDFHVIFVTHWHNHNQTTLNYGLYKLLH